MRSVHSQNMGGQWEFGVSTAGTRLVKIKDGLWLSAPGHRVTLGCLTSNTMTTKETEDLVCTTMRERTGSKTLDWNSFGGRDVVFVDDSELHLVEHILDTCGEIVVNVYT